MAFDTQITDLVGGTIDQVACDQWASDACKEIIHVLPSKLKAKCATISELSHTATTLDVDNKGEILHVTRLSANSGGYQLPCREIPAMYGGLAEDSTDLNYYATATDPVYWVDSSSEVSTLKVKPTPEATQKALVHHIAYPSVTVNTHNTIANFPDEAEYLVVLYTAIKQLHQYMNSKRSDLPSDLTLPVLESISESLPSWSAPSDFVAPTVPVAPASPSFSTPTIAAVTLTNAGVAPLYTKPSLTARVSFNSFFESGSLNPLDDADPGEFSITAVAPTVPSTPSYTTPDISSTTVSSTTVSVIGVAPTYTPPSITSTAGSPDDLTDMIGSDWSALDYDFADENIDFATWFQATGDMIQNQEDLELASAQLQKISSYVQTYNVAMQNRLNVFNKENVAYQGKLQEGIQQAQINATKAQGQAQISATEAQQEASLLLQKESQEYSSKLQKYQAEISTYQANVNKEVQGYVQSLQRYTTELGTAYQAWAKTESDSLQQYSSDIQNNLNDFNRANAEYQTKLQEGIQQAQIDATDAQQEASLKLQKENQEYIAKLQKYQAELGKYATELNSNVQTFTSAVTKNRAAFDTSMQKYASEVSKVSSSNASTLQKFQIETADFSSKLQKQTTDYQWYQGQYMQLRADYQQGLQQLISGGLPAPQQQERRR